jgi:hypothetical protein
VAAADRVRLVMQMQRRQMRVQRHLVRAG